MPVAALCTLLACAPSHVLTCPGIPRHPKLLSWATPSPESHPILLPKYLWFIFTPQNASGSFWEGRKTLQQCETIPRWLFPQGCGCSPGSCYSHPVKSGCSQGSGTTGLGTGFPLAPWPQQQGNSRAWAAQALHGLWVIHKIHPRDTREATRTKRVATANTSTRPSLVLLQNCSLRQVSCSFTIPGFLPVSQR